jgi:hypothetical protein
VIVIEGKTVDVVHITQESYDKFQKLGADEDFRQAVIAEGFSIHLNFGDGVQVWHGNTNEGILRNGKGATLSEALWDLFLDYPGVGSGELHEEVTRRFQAECPHDQGTYIRDNPLMPQCNRCHKYMGKG